MASTIPVPPTANGSSSNPPEASGITIDQIAQHKSRESLWLLLHDKVYDVTKFMDEHPGGDEVLLEESGRDATEAFEDVGHSDEARAMLPKMLIGEFSGPKKVAKSVLASGGSGTATASKSAGSSITYIIPVALIGAFLAWRFLYA